MDFMTILGNVGIVAITIIAMVGLTLIVDHFWNETEVDYDP